MPPQGGISVSGSQHVRAIHAAQKCVSIQCGLHLVRFALHPSRIYAGHMFNLKLQDDLQAVFDRYEKMLSQQLRLKALARTFNKAHALALERLEVATKTSHNVSSALIDKAYAYKGAKEGDTSATATVTGKGLSLRTFVVSGGTRGETVGVLVKRPATLRTGFLVRTPTGKDVGVFVRDTARGKVATQKGSYAGRVITRGPNKGRALERQAVEKLYTMSVPSAVKANVPTAFETLELAGMLQAEMEALMHNG